MADSARETLPAQSTEGNRRNRFGHLLCSIQHERGEVTQTRFYDDYGDGNGEREVQIRIYRDGHVTTSKPVLPDFVSDLREHIESTLEYREYLISLNRQMKKYTPIKGQRELQFEEGNYRRRVDLAFDKLVSNYIINEKYDDTVQTVYKAVIVNIGIELMKADLDNGSYPNPDQASDRPRDENNLQDFFEDYSDFELKGVRTDFDEIWDHLYYILSENRLSTPIELIDQVTTEYDFNN